jgi:hypothetical protein
MPINSGLNKTEFEALNLFANLAITFDYHHERVPTCPLLIFILSIAILSM